MPSPTLIEAAHLRKSYGAGLALDDVTFSVNAGEVVGRGPRRLRLQSLWSFLLGQTIALLRPRAWMDRLNSLPVNAEF
jgi:hypothetical protein